jgi:hypothetical protein
MNKQDEAILREYLKSVTPQDMQRVRNIMPDDPKWQILLDQLEAAVKEELEKLRRN